MRGAGCGAVAGQCGVRLLHHLADSGQGFPADTQRGAIPAGIDAKTRPAFRMPQARIIETGKSLAQGKMSSNEQLTGPVQRAQNGARATNNSQAVQRTPIAQPASWPACAARFGGACSRPAPWQIHCHRFRSGHAECVPTPAVTPT